MTKFNQLYESTISFLTEKESETIAIVPGSFKPPHAGHWDMITKYSKKADKVIVLISAPSAKSERKTKTGAVITPKMAEKIFDIYKKAAGLKNVEIQISDSASPVKAAYDMLDKLDGKRVIFGSSTKDNDWKRWEHVPKYVEKNGFNVEVLDSKDNSVQPLKTGSVDISASTIRDNIGNIEIIKSMLPKNLNNSDVQKIMDILK